MSAAGWVTVASGVAEVDEANEDDYTSHEYWIDRDADEETPTYRVGTAHTDVGLVTYEARAFDSVRAAEAWLAAVYAFIIEAEWPDEAETMAGALGAEKTEA